VTRSSGEGDEDAFDLLDVVSVIQMSVSLGDELLSGWTRPHLLDTVLDAQTRKLSHQPVG
jgi:hypothetical protein